MNVSAYYYLCCCSRLLNLQAFSLFDKDGNGERNDLTAQPLFGGEGAVSVPPVGVGEGEGGGHGLTPGGASG